MKEKKKLSLAAQIFIALVLAVIAGLLMQKYANFAETYIKPFGTIFLNLLKFIVVPIVLFSIMCGIISMKDIKKVGSIGAKTVVYYMCTTAFAITFGLIGANMFKGAFPKIATTDLSYKADQTISLMDTIVNIFPSNFVSPMVEANMLQVIVTALILGFGIILLGEGERNTRLVTACNDLNDVFMKCMEMILKLSPIGVFCLLSPVIASNGPAIIGSLAMVLLAAYVCYIIHKLYLYYTQKGRCMYSGEVIELKDLWDNTKYDIDHIYPQSKTMDDSLNNRVLVKKKYNATKSDKYPLNENIRHERKGFWKSLLDGGFISKEKYERLIRNTELSPEELAGFIERQIVETRQSTKAVAEILKQVFPESEIVYVKAGTVSRFRKDFELLKVREVNDLHHAKDAYLNIVVGNSYYVKFTKNASWFIKENPGRTYNLKKMFTSGWNIERNGEVAWEVGKKGTIVTVKQIMNKNNILVTRQVHEAKGGLFDQQIMKKGKGQIAIKESDKKVLFV